MKEAAVLPDRPDIEVRRIVAASGTSFVAGMGVLPAPRRAAIFAVYAFCRVVDDIADGSEAPAAKLVRLDRWERELDRVYRARPHTAIGAELVRAVDAYALPRGEFELMLEGMRMDAEGIVAPEPATLDGYVRRVAGSVGILSMRIFGAWRGAPSERFALSLAEAMQLTNILRDVQEDADMGRLYLPRPLLTAAGVPPEPRLAARHPRLPEARRRLGRIARERFRSASAEASAHAWPRLLPALMMMGPYERLLRRMEADWTSPPPRRAGWRKALDGARCAAAFALR
jgi:phytoene synthase